MKDLLAGIVLGGGGVLITALIHGWRINEKRQRLEDEFSHVVKDLGPIDTPSPVEVYCDYCTERKNYPLEIIKERLVDLDPGPGRRPSEKRVRELLDRLQEDPFLLFGELARYQGLILVTNKSRR